MPISKSTRQFFDDMAGASEVQKPSPGKRVRVIGGRKHNGKIGYVIRHQESQFYGRFAKKKPTENLALREVEGRVGYICLVKNEADGTTFWVDADKVDVIDLLGFKITE